MPGEYNAFGVPFGWDTPDYVMKVIADVLVLYRSQTISDHHTDFNVTEHDKSYTDRVISIKQIVFAWCPPAVGLSVIGLSVVLCCVVV